MADSLSGVDGTEADVHLRRDPSQVARCALAIVGKKSTSRFRGVNRHSRSNRWETHIWHGGRQVHLGCFLDELQAAAAYDIIALKLRGPTTVLNFPLHHYADELPCLSSIPADALISLVRLSRRRQAITTACSQLQPLSAATQPTPLTIHTPTPTFASSPAASQSLKPPCNPSDSPTKRARHALTPAPPSNPLAPSAPCSTTPTPTSHLQPNTLPNPIFQPHYPIPALQSFPASTFSSFLYPTTQPCFHPPAPNSLHPNHPPLSCTNPTPLSASHTPSCPLPADIVDQLMADDTLAPSLPIHATVPHPTAVPTLPLSHGSDDSCQSSGSFIPMDQDPPSDPQALFPTPSTNLPSPTPIPTHHNPHTLLSHPAHTTPPAALQSLLSAFPDLHSLNPASNSTLFTFPTPPGMYPQAPNPYTPPLQHPALSPTAPAAAPISSTAAAEMGQPGFAAMAGQAPSEEPDLDNMQDVVVAAAQLLRARNQLRRVLRQRRQRRHSAPSHMQPVLVGPEFGSAQVRPVDAQAADMQALEDLVHEASWQLLANGGLPNGEW